MKRLLSNTAIIIMHLLLAVTGGRSYFLGLTYYNKIEKAKRMLANAFRAQEE